MAGMAAWDDPVVTWNSLLYSWDGESLFPVDIAALLRQRSAFTRTDHPRPFTRITPPRVFARLPA